MRGLENTLEKYYIYIYIYTFIMEYIKYVGPDLLFLAGPDRLFPAGLDFLFPAGLDLLFRLVQKQS